jgi:thiamine kinase-like enzyme
MLNTIGSDLKVIITSGYSPDGFEKLPDEYGREKCRAILKAQLLSDTDPKRMEVVVAELLNLKADHSGKTKRIKLDPVAEDDIYLKYLIESIGGETAVKELILTLQKELKYDIDASHFTINSLNQGLSGAMVFNLVVLDSNNNPTYKFIKLSKDKNSLNNELAKVRSQYYKISTNYTLSYSNNEPILFKDYYVIVATLVEKSISLRKKIFEDKNGDLSIRIISELATTCLKELYQKQRLKNIPEQIVHSILKVFDTRRIAFLNMADEELKILTGKINIVQEIEKLKKVVTDSSIFYEKDNLKNTLVHGDLHSNNVIISENNKLFIVDPANMNQDHWSRDICMLIVDLFAYGIDVDTKEYFGIDLTKWTDMGKNILNNQEIENGGINPSIVASINWLINKENLNDIFSNLFELWEYQLSLGIEFLRASYKSDTLPAGKRAACLLIGKEALNFAKQTYKDLK